MERERDRRRKIKKEGKEITLIRQSRAPLRNQFPFLLSCHLQVKRPGFVSFIKKEKKEKENFFLKLFRRENLGFWTRNENTCQQPKIFRCCVHLCRWTAAVSHFLLPSPLFFPAMSFSSYDNINLIIVAMHIKLFCAAPHLSCADCSTSN